MKCYLQLLLYTAIFYFHATAQNNYPLVRTSQQGTVNHSLPKNALAADEPITAVFSKEPKDEEFFRVHFFEEPLVPTAGKYSAEENQALLFALASFNQRTSPDDFTSINNFLKQYPKSRWQGALLANLGIIYRTSGYYNKAMDSWQQAWKLMKNEHDRRVTLLADKVMSELLLINCWVGRRQEIESLLAEINNRPMDGPAVERIESVRTALFIMKKRSGIAFKCGPYALNKIYRLKDSTKPFNEKATNVQSPSSGFSLTQLKVLAHKNGLKYQMAFRKPGAEIIDSVVIHWKLDHYSTLLKNNNGYIVCEDPTMGTTYGQQFWLTPAALDSSASGYFLVPDGILPKGWRKVNDAEGSKVFGKGVLPPDNGKHLSCSDQKSGDNCSTCKGMARCNVHLAAVSLHIFDNPFFYSVPKGPAVNWQVDYHQRDDYQPANFNYSNFGNQWTFQWLSYVQQDNPGVSADVYLMGGGVRTFVGYNLSTKSYAPELQSDDVLAKIDTFCYELRHPDGSKEVYSRPDNGSINKKKVFLTYVIDVANDTLSISYDNNLRIVALKDALGQITTVKYDNADIYKITAVTALGRSAFFDYDGSGRLQKITDMLGMVSTFQYNTNTFITQMSTPYGTTSFVKKDGGDDDNFRSLEITYPLGAKERVEFKEQAPGIAFSESTVPAGMINNINTGLFNQWLTYRNTFYWDKKAMLEAPGDYTKAKIYHWLHGSEDADENGFVSPLLESFKEPLENRIWYLYQNQNWGGGANQDMSSSPALTGRVLNDGTTQLKQFGYNTLGIDTFSLDPLNRRTSYKYDSTNIHLLEIRQTTSGINELLTGYTYDSQHPNLPKTSTDASGQKTTYSYNFAGQIQTITNSKKETTTFNYDGNGYLTNITGPVAGSTVSFTYDGFGRVRTVTDPEGYKITTDYDMLDRPTVTTYPDGSFEQIVYDRMDAVHMKDRLGRWSHNLYDSLDRLNAVTDALGLITQFIWCTCGNLSEIVDPLKQITTFTYDLQSRLISKIYDDNKTVSYNYDTSGRLTTVVDAKGQTTKYAYLNDDNLKLVTYSNAIVATPSVSFFYDIKYNRITTMRDGSGTTAYSYYPINKAPVLGAGKLQKINGPLNNDDIVYTYDSLGRINSRSINNVASSMVYDALGRITAATNTLGTFGYNYVDVTNRLLSITNPNNTTTNFTYFDNASDQRLKEIWNKTGSTTLSKFDYTYNKEGQITTWAQQLGTFSKFYELGYDLADQLTSATQKNSTDSSLAKRYAYQYDNAGNRTSEQIDNSITSSIYNTLNQMTAQQSGGPMRFKGTVNEFSTIKIANTTTSDTSFAAIDSATNTFEAFVKTVPGQNNISITSTDFSGNNNTKTTSYTLTTTTGTNNTLSYDANGNSISESNPAITYDWDAADRLVKITQGTNVTEFVYDGLSRRVAEKLNSVIIKRWLWCGTELCEERDSSGNVIKRFFPQGEQIGSTNYYFTRDHLGSIRELTNSSGALLTRYDYDPYGKRTKLSGTIDADFGFTGYYYHAASGLYLALYRAYEPGMGRWLNRDPIKEKGGINIYRYCNNNPLLLIDKYGLCMKKCPSHLNNSDPTPPGFKPYEGWSWVFHCGFRTILEDKKPSPESPKNECVYDDDGNLIGNNHKYAGCQGTPDSYDAGDWWNHFANDPGGIWQAGGPAFLESRKHDFDNAWQYISDTYHHLEDGFISTVNGWIGSFYQP